LGSVLSFIERAHKYKLYINSYQSKLRLGFVRIAIVERHSAAVTDVLRFVGLTHIRQNIDNVSKGLCWSSSGKIATVRYQ